MSDPITQPTDESKKIGTLEKLWTKYGFDILKLLIAAALSFGAAAYWFKYNGRLRTLRYTLTPSPGLLQKPELKGKQLTVLLDQKPIENLSTVGLYLVNPTDQDFENLQVVVSFQSRSGKAPELLQVNSRVPAYLFEEKSRQTDGNTLQIEYNVKVANRGEHFIFAADYIFDGADSPKGFVKVVKTGVDIEEVQLATINQAKTSVPWILGSVVFGVSGWITFMIFGLLGRGAKFAEIESRLERAEFLAGERKRKSDALLRVSREQLENLLKRVDAYESQKKQQ